MSQGSKVSLRQDTPKRHHHQAVSSGMAKWNHRVVDLSSPQEPCVALREVYYDEEGKPAAHGEPFVSGDNLEELSAVVHRLTEALGQPILKPEDFIGSLGAE